MRSTQAVTPVAPDHDDREMTLTGFTVHLHAHRLLAVTRAQPAAVRQDDLFHIRYVVNIAFHGQGIAPPDAHALFVVEAAVVAQTLEDPRAADRFDLDVPLPLIARGQAQPHPVEQARAGNEG